MKNNRSVVFLTLLNILGALLALVYAVVQVQYFGVSREIEIYFAATSLIYLILSLTQSGQLGEVFLPTYHRLKEEYNFDTAFQAFSVVINWMTIATIFLSIATYIFAGFLIELIVPGFSDNDKILAVKLFKFFVLFFFLEIINSFLNTLLNAEKIYGKTEFTNSINTLVSVLILVIFYKSWGIWSLAIGMFAGKIIQFLMTMLILPKINFKYFFILKSPHFDHKTFFKTIFSTFTYVGATQFYNIILTSSISFLPVGVFAVFKYVQNLFTKVRGVFIAPINTVFFTEFSKSFNQTNDQLASIVKKSVDYSLFILFSVLIFAISFGDILLDILWSGKKFDQSSLNLAYSFLVLNFCSLIFSGVGSIYRRTLIVYGKAKQLYFYFSLAQLITAGITFLLIKYFDIQGLKWIIIINVFLLQSCSFLLTYFQNRHLVKVFNFKHIFKLIAYSIIITAAGLFIKNYLTLNFSIIGDRETGITKLLIDTFLLTLIGFFTGFLLKIQELGDLSSYIKVKFQKGLNLIK